MPQSQQHQKSNDNLQLAPSVRGTTINQSRHKKAKHVINAKRAGKIRHWLSNFPVMVDENARKTFC